MALPAALAIGLGPARPIAGASTVPLGIYDGTHSPASIETIASWLGAPGDVSDALEFIAATSWSTISDPSWFLSQWSGTPYQMTWAVPMMPCGSPSTSCAPNAAEYNSLASGADDGYFTTLAQNLVAAGQGSSYIRLGWEMNGSWFPWTVCNSTGAADFVPSYRNIVTSMRSVAGAHFKFIWNPDDTSGGCAAQIENFYPGDSYVTVVALDVYDAAGTTTTDQARWQDLLDGVSATGWAPTAPDPIGGTTFEGYGLDWLKSFGALHDKAIGLPEWGLWSASTSGGGGDDPYFVEQMAAWVEANASAPCNFWDYGTAITVSGVSSGDPLSTAAFKAAFGGPPAATPPATATSSPATATSSPATATSSPATATSSPATRTQTISLTGSSTVVTGWAAAATLAVPPSCAAGTVGVLEVSTYNTQTLTTPSGWTLVADRISTGAAQLAVYEQTMTGSSSTASVALSSRIQVSASLLCFAGVDTAAAVESVGTSAWGTGTSISIPGVATTAAGSEVVVLVGSARSGSPAAAFSSPLTSITAATAVTAWSSASAGSLTSASAGATGSLQATYSQANNWLTFALALRPAPEAAEVARALRYLLSCGTLNRPGFDGGASALIAHAAGTWATAA